MDKIPCPFFGHRAERVQWTQSVRRSVGNRKERLRGYASSPGQQPSVTMREVPISKNQIGAAGDVFDSDSD